ncbi:cytochrome P450 [Xylariaceae sp. AK1471]|nr:cytochrome P450 [Xylariaceae sp. AK1471]
MEGSEFPNTWTRGLLEAGGLPLNVRFLILILLLTYVLWRLQHPKSNEPPSIPELIPFFSNTYLFATNHHVFLEKCAAALQKSSIAQFRLGGTRTYAITGPQNIQAIFKSSAGIRDETVMEMFTLPKLWAMSPREVDLFKRDRTGKLKTPMPGAKQIPEDQRHWALNHHIYEQFLSSKKHADLLAEKYYELFYKRLEKYSTEEWTTVFVMKGLTERDMTESALTALAGPKLLEINPGFIEKFWEYDPLIADLGLGKPRWLNPRPWRVRDSYLEMPKKWIESAWANFDWNGPDKDADWEVNFGSPVCRELARWMRGSFCIEAQAGFFGTFFIGQNSNTIAITTWALMELIRDPDLFRTVQEEILTVCTINPDTGSRTFDVPKLLALPMLQSVYVETMRMRMSFSPMREVVAPVTMGGYDLKKGSLVFAPNHVAHYSEAAWGAEGHPASEFWGARHIKYVEKLDEHGNVVREPKFELASHRNNFFPYGGGPSMCPGRFFAKQKFTTTIALLLVRFDIEFVEWTHPDGSRSDRGAESDRSCAGAVAIPPDRDMKVRLKRRW